MEDDDDDDSSIPSPPPFFRVSGHFTPLNPSRPMALAKLSENAAIPGDSIPVSVFAFDKNAKQGQSKQSQTTESDLPSLELLPGFSFDDIFQDDMDLEMTSSPNQLDSLPRTDSVITTFNENNQSTAGSGRFIETPDGLALLLHKNADQLRVETSQPRRNVRWTVEEDDLLRTAVEFEGGPPHNWKRIAEKYFHGSRNAFACKGRWNKTFQPGVRLAKWTPSEDATVIRGHQSGLSWPEISSMLQGRTAEQVRYHFINEIDPTLNRKPFSKAERERLFELQAQYGNKWTQIAREMPGRSEQMVKNCWFNAKVSQQRKLRRDLVKQLS